MPILVGFCHLLYDLHNIHVGRLHCSVHLWPIGRGPVMLDLEALQLFLGPLGDEVRAIVRDDRVRDPILGNDVVSDKHLGRCSYDSLLRGSFHPLSEVVDCYQNEAMTV